MKKVKLSYGEMLQMAADQDIDPTELMKDQEAGDKSAPVQAEPQKEVTPSPVVQVPIPQEETIKQPTEPKGKPKAKSGTSMDIDSAMIAKIKQVVADFDLEGQTTSKFSDYTCCRIPWKQYLRISHLRTAARVSQYALLGAIIERFLSEMEAEIEIEKNE